jgi:hypothetical protein
MYRINKQDLENQVEYINRLHDLPNEPYSKVQHFTPISLSRLKNTTGHAIPTKYQPNAGVFHLSWAYGGVSLHTMSEKEGCTGIRDVFSIGHVPKRELHTRMQSYIIGLENPATTE